MSETEDIKEKIRTLLDDEENLEPSSSFFICKQLADDYFLEWEGSEEEYEDDEDEFEGESPEDSNGDVSKAKSGGDKPNSKQQGTKADTPGSSSTD